MSETNVSIQGTETMFFLNLSLKDLIKYPKELRKVVAGKRALRGRKWKSVSSEISFTFEKQCRQN